MRFTPTKASTLSLLLFVIFSQVNARIVEKQEKSEFEALKSEDLLNQARQSSYDGNSDVLTSSSNAYPLNRNRRHSGGRPRNIQLPKPENLDVDSYGNVDQYPEGLNKLIAQNTAGDVCAANNTKNSMKGYVFYVECPKSSTTPDEPPKCIKSNDFCNGVADCPGGTDEAPDRCLWHRLEQEQMQVLRSEIYQIMRSRERRKQKSHHYVRKNYSREDDDENDDVVVRHKKKKHRRSLRRILNLGDDNSSSLDSEYRRR